MATIDYTTPIEDPDGGSYIYRTASGLALNDDSAPINAPGQGDRSVACTGTFDASTITIQGANTKGTPQAADWQTLRDSFGNNLTFTAAGLKQVHERCKWIRAVSAGGTSPSVTVAFFIPRRAA